MKTKRCIIYITAILCSILFLIGAFVLILYNRVYDKTIISNDYKEINSDKVFSDLSVNALNNIEIDGKVKLTISIDDAFALISVFLKEQLNGYITGCKFQILENNNLNIAISLKIGSFYTVFSTDVSVKVTDDGIAIKLNNIKLGKADINFIKFFLSENIINNKLNNNNEQYFTFNYNNTEIFISKELLIKYLSKLYDKQWFSSYVDAMALRCFTQQSILNIYLGAEDKFGAEIDLNSFAYSNEDEKKPYDIDAIKIAQDCETLLNSKKIKTNQSELVYRFLVQGYSALSDSDKKTVNSIDFTLINIPNPTLYDGVLVADVYTFDELIKRQLALSYNIIDGLNIRIFESDLNNIFQKTGVVGACTLFCNTIGDKYDINFIVTEAVYFSIIRDSLTVNIIISISGFPIILKANFDSENTNNLKLDMILKSAAIGKHIATSNEENLVLKFLTDSTASMSWIKCNFDTKTITFDFTDVVNFDAFQKLFKYYTVNTTTENKYLNINIRSYWV